MKFKFLCLIIFMFFLSPLTTDAALCTTSTYATLKEKAINIKMEWELKFDEGNNSYFEVSASNVDSELMLILGSIIYEPDENGNITLSVPLEGGQTYQFKFYGGYYHPCVEEYVYTFNLNIPKYNKYSEYDECKEHPEWELCDKWYSGSIASEEDFYQKLEEYETAIKNGDIVVEDKNSTKINIVFISIISVAVIATLAVVVIKRKKKAKKTEKQI